MTFGFLVGDRELDRSSATRASESSGVKIAGFESDRLDLYRVHLTVLGVAGVVGSEEEEGGWGDASISFWIGRIDERLIFDLESLTTGVSGCSASWFVGGVDGISTGSSLSVISCASSMFIVVAGVVVVVVVVVEQGVNRSFEGITDWEEGDCSLFD